MTITKKNRGRKTIQESGLTDKRQKFAHEYVKCFNITQAALNAGCTAKSAHTTGCAMMRDPLVRGLIANLKEKMFDELKLEAKDVLKQLAYIATRDANDFRDDETGHLTTDLNKLNPRARACVDGFKQKVRTWTEDDGTVKTEVEMELKLVPKATGIDMLMKHFGLYLKDNQQRGEQKLTIDLSNLMQDKKDAPNEVEQRIIDVKATPIEQPKYGLRELIDEGGDVD